MVVNATRRGFLAGVGALVLATQLPVPAHASESGAELNAFVRIDPDGRITVAIPSSEMGQGVLTSMAMIVAEELDADWSKVHPEPSLAQRDYELPGALGRSQTTGGSNSIRGWHAGLRDMGAAARAMLVAAAASEWGVDPGECTTGPSVVKHGHKQLGYGELAAAASLGKPPKAPVWKDPADYRIVGTDLRRVELRDKVTGAATFGIDTRLPGMVYASVRQCPVFGGDSPSLGNREDVQAMAGVIDVQAHEAFVAVVAQTWWQAHQACKKLEVSWNEGANADLDSAAISEQLLAALDGKAAKGHAQGKAIREIEAADQVIESTFEVPYLDHAPISPINCTARVTPDAVELWAPTQVQTRVRKLAAQITGLSLDQVTVHTTLLGGGFGRRGNWDDSEMVVRIAQQLGDGRPVQMIWSREEAFQHGWYRPAYAARLRGVVRDGKVHALHSRVAGGNILHRYVPGLLYGLGPVKAFPQEGIENTPYHHGLPHFLSDWARVDSAVPIGFWRSVGHSHNAFFFESFIDELAHAAGTDPVELRRGLLHPHGRHRKVLDTVAQAADWGHAPEGRVQGVAMMQSYGSVCAQVVELSMDGDTPRVHKITAAIDCGPVIHPENVKAQVMGGAIFGLSAAMHGKITVADGRVEQSNFHDYGVLRMNEAPPVVDVHLVSGTGAPIGGVGEPGTPPIAPAVCNAIFAATGQRIRRLPILEALRGSA